MTMVMLGYTDTESLLSSGNYNNIELVGSVTLGTASTLCGPQRLK